MVDSDITRQVFGYSNTLFHNVPTPSGIQVPGYIMKFLLILIFYMFAIRFLAKFGVIRPLIAVLVCAIASISLIFVVLMSAAEASRFSRAESMSAYEVLLGKEHVVGKEPGNKAK